MRLLNNPDCRTSLEKMNRMPRCFKNELSSLVAAKLQE